MRASMRATGRAGRASSGRSKSSAPSTEREAAAAGRASTKSDAPSDVDTEQRSARCGPKSSSKPSELATVPERPEPETRGEPVKKSPKKSPKKKPNRMQRAKDAASKAIVARHGVRAEKVRSHLAAATAAGLSPAALQALNEVQRAEANAATRAPLAFDGNQALFPGERPASSLSVFDPKTGDDVRTVMTVRTTKGDVRLYEAASRLDGHTYPMTWAKLVLRAAAKARIVEAAR